MSVMRRVWLVMKEGRVQVRNTSGVPVRELLPV
jgi:hypothetical protein